MFQDFKRLRWVVDCTTNSCRSSVFSAVDEFTDGEDHDARCKMLAALLATKM